MGNKKKQEEGESVGPPEGGVEIEDEVVLNPLADGTSSDEAPLSPKSPKKSPRKVGGQRQQRKEIANEEAEDEKEACSAV